MSACGKATCSWGELRLCSAACNWFFLLGCVIGFLLLWACVTDRKAGAPRQALCL
jgi:hypothetical protein